MAVLKGGPYVWTSWYSLFVSSGFGGKARFDMNTSHMFPQGVLASITIGGEGAGDSGPRAGSRCEEGLPLCSVTVTTLLGVSQVSSCWNRSPKGRVWGASVPFKCVFFCFSAVAPLAPEKSNAGTRGNGVGFGQVSGHRVWQSGHCQRSGLPVMCCLCYQQ